MSATDELRRLLDERGIKYHEVRNVNGANLYFDWSDKCGGYTKCVGVAGNDCYVEVEYIEPYEAVGIALWREKCRNIGDGMRFECSECHQTVGGETPRFCPNCGMEVEK